MAPLRRKNKSPRINNKQSPRTSSSKRSYPLKRQKNAHIDRTKDPKKVMVGILHYNRPNKLYKCVRLIEDQAGYPHRTVIQNNGGLGDTGDKILKDFPNVTIFHSNTNLGMAEGYNQLLKRRKGNEWIVISNDDNFVQRDNWLDELVRKARKYKNVGCVAYNNREEWKYNVNLKRRIKQSDGSYDAVVRGVGIAFRLINPAVIRKIGGYYAPKGRKRWVCGTEYQSRVAEADFNIYVIDYGDAPKGRRSKVKKEHSHVIGEAGGGYKKGMRELRDRIRHYNEHNLYVPF